MFAWLLAAVIVLVGIFQLLQGQLIFALVLFVLAAIVGPGGYSIFRRRQTA